MDWLVLGNSPVWLFNRLHIVMAFFKIGHSSLQLQRADFGFYDEMSSKKPTSNNDNLLLTALLNGVVRGLAWVEENSPGARRMKRIEALRSWSDYDLAQLGLSREDIAQYVFQDTYYT